MFGNDGYRGRDVNAPPPISPSRVHVYAEHAERLTPDQVSRPLTLRSHWYVQGLVTVFSLF